MPSFSPHAAAGKRDMRSGRERVVRSDVLRYHQQVELGQRRARRIGARQRCGGVGADDPQRFDAAIGNRLEHLDRLESRARGYPRRAPEALHAVDLGGREAHVRRQHIGHPTDFAAAHGVRLARERQRTRAGPADAAGGEMASNDGSHFIGALGRLIDSLRIDRDHPRSGTPIGDERRDLSLGEAGRAAVAATVGAISRARASVASKPLVCAARNARRARHYRRDAPGDARTARYPCRV